MTFDQEQKRAISLERITPISQHDFNFVGIELTPRLLEINPLLNPADLRRVVRSYNNFEPIAGSLMWQRASSEQVEKRHDQILLCLSGLPATGKHHALTALESLLNEPPVGLITDTTRPPKEIMVIQDRKEMKTTEKDGLHHNFLRIGEFKEKIRAGCYIEWIEQRPDMFYGTPHTALAEALNQNKPLIVTDLEIASGWPQIERAMITLPPDKRPKILQVFMLPGLTVKQFLVDYKDGLSWLKIKRPGDYEARGVRAVAEIYFAPQRAQFLLVNPINEGEEVLPRVAQALAATIQRFSSVPLLRTR